MSKSDETTQNSLLEALAEEDRLTPVQYSTKPTELILTRQIEQLSTLFQTTPRSLESQIALAELRELSQWLNSNPKFKWKGIPK